MKVSSRGRDNRASRKVVDGDAEFEGSGRKASGLRYTQTLYNVRYYWMSLIRKTNFFLQKEIVRVKQKDGRKERLHSYPRRSDDKVK